MTFTVLTANAKTPRQSNSVAEQLQVSEALTCHSSQAIGAGSSGITLWLQKALPSV